MKELSTNLKRWWIQLENKQKQHQFNMIEKCSQRQSLSIILRRQLKRYKKKRKSSKKKV
jgi:hypothetical protein